MIKTKDQTIVEWLRQEYKNPNRDIFMDDLFLKALEMEKEQMTKYPNKLIIEFIMWYLDQDEETIFEAYSIYKNEIKKS